jgi:hypothetical protein
VELYLDGTREVLTGARPGCIGLSSAHALAPCPHFRRATADAWDQAPLLRTLGVADQSLLSALNLLVVNATGPVSPAAALAFQHPPGLNDSSLLRYRGQWIASTGRYPPPSGSMLQVLEVRYAGTLQLPQIDYEAYQYCDKGQMG